jgi:Holliday junction DNA helicase RuvB
MIISSEQTQEKDKIPTETEIQNVIQKLQNKPNLDDEIQLRPNKLDSFIGQGKLKKQLKIILESARIREKMPEHLLFYGQPGLGKTTLASLISSELGVNFKVTSAPGIQKQGDLVSLLLNLEPKTVLFIDEIHRLKAPLEETLYTAMEDKQVDLVMGKGAGAQSARLDLNDFTLVGATTMLGKLSKPLKDRFPSIFNLEKYTEEEIKELVTLNSKKMGLKISDSAKDYVCKRCRGVPRITNNILKRILDYQIVHEIDEVQTNDIKEFLYELGVYENGLTKTDIKYLQSLEDNSLGLKSLSSILMEEKDTLEQVIEPYLMYLGYIDKSSLGRKLTPRGRDFLNSFNSNQ